MYPSLATQRGAALLVLVGLIAAASTLFIIGQSRWQSQARLNELPEVRASRVEDAALALRRWYERNAAEIEVSSYSVPNGATLLELAGVPRQWALTAAMSTTQLDRDGIKYRVIAVWAPTDDDYQTPVFDPNTGELDLCPDSSPDCGQRAAAKIDGHRIQAERYKATAQSLRTIAGAAQAYFHGHWLADPDHNLSVNYFRSCDAPRGNLPCLGSPTAIDANFLAELGLPEAYRHDAWGGAIEGMNGGSLAAAPPYRLELKATTPWGEPIVVYAIQRL